MRKNIRKIVASFWMLSCTCAFAQMSGTYTIGGSGANFATINAAYSALKAQGGKGSVIFKLNPGTYNETLKFVEEDFPTYDWPSDFTLTGTNATIVSSDSEATVLFSVQGYKVEGITIKNTGNGAALSLQHVSGSYEIKNNTLQSTGEAVVYLRESEENLIQNNRIIGGDYGILANSANKAYIYDNDISQFKRAGFISKDDFNAVDYYGYEIKRNLIEGREPASGSSLYCGILLRNGFENSIEDNEIYVSSTSGNVYGIYDDASRYGTYANNYITVLGTGIKFIDGENCTLINNSVFSTEGKGIEVSATAVNLINNEITSYKDDCVNVTGKVTAINNSTFLYNSLIGAAFRATTGSKIVNNSFFNSSTSSSTCAIQLNSITTCDYNNLYSLSSQLGIYNNVARTSLSAWRSATGKDIHSISADPLYSDPELGSTQINLSSPLVNKANASEMPAYDKTGEPREYNAIGAWDPYPSSSWPGGTVSRRASDLRKALRESRMLQSELNEQNVLDSNVLAPEYSINYSSGLLNVVSSAQEDAAYTLIVADMLTGEVRIQTSVVLVGGISQSIDLSVLPQGYYVVRLVTATGTNSWKITR